MKLRFGLIVGAFALALAACQSAPGTVYDKHTGNKIEHSGRYPLAASLLWNLNGVAGHSEKRGFNLAVEYSSTGLDWMFFEQAWSYGRQLEYTVVDRSVAGCSGGCTLLERGGIHLSESDFRKAASTGFEFALVGKRGKIEGKMPAKAFQEVLDQMAK